MSRTTRLVTQRENSGDTANKGHADTPTQMCNNVKKKEVSVQEGKRRLIVQPVSRTTASFKEIQSTSHAPEVEEDTGQPAHKHSSLTRDANFLGVRLHAGSLCECQITHRQSL